jgi:hypothetical protein
MSYKTLNDKVRRRALIPFLDMGLNIRGWLITFAVSKNGQSLFESPANNRDPEVSEMLSIWKESVHERLLRILHMSTFLVSGLSVPGQDILWVTDEDDIAANVSQLTGLTNLFAVITSNSLNHNLRHLRCATARSDDGSRSLEDLLSYADLAAGTVCEYATAIQGNHKFLQKSVISPVPRSISWKSRTILPWLASSAGDLHRLTCLIDLADDQQKIVATMLRWHTLPWVYVHQPDR